LLATVAVIPKVTPAAVYGGHTAKINGRIRPPKFRKSCSAAQYREQRHRERKRAKTRGDPVPHFAGFTDSEDNESDHEPAALPNNGEWDNEQSTS
jgi:hypothetical protein